MTAFDYSAGTIAPAALKAAGASVAMRYVSTPGNSKNIGRAEYEQLTAAGIEVGLVYETSADWMLGGYNAGAAAARAARAQATAAGYPTSRRIWYAADFDATAAQVLTVLDALHGAADAEGNRARVAVYGGYAVVSAAADAGFTAPWQTVAWSGSRWDPRATLRQIGQTRTVAGVEVDVNELAGDPFAVPQPSPAAAAALEEETMIILDVSADPTKPAGPASATRWLYNGSQLMALQTGQDVTGLTAAGVKTAEVSMRLIQHIADRLGIEVAKL